MWGNVAAERTLQPSHPIMRHLLLLTITTTMMAAMATTVAGCSGSSAEDAGLSEADVTGTTKVCTSDGSCPTTLAELTTMKSGDLHQLFEAGGMGNEVFSGVYRGVPLCFPSEIPAPEAFPAGARSVIGFDLLVRGVRLLSQDHMNGIAGWIWHGKKFTPRQPGSLADVIAQQRDLDMVPIADVKNNIGRTDVDFSAEAILVADRPGRSIDLDYHVAETGLELPGNIPILGVSSVSTEIIQHIWDRVRLINAEANLYLGVAYVVDTPGKYDQTAVPMCYFALQPE